MTNSRLTPGVWNIEPIGPIHCAIRGEDWIEVRESQRKYIEPDGFPFVFEVNRFASTSGSAALGKQLIEVLAAQGVPSTVFVDILREEIEREVNALLDFSDPLVLLHTVESTTGVLRSRVIPTPSTKRLRDVGFQEDIARSRRSNEPINSESLSSVPIFAAERVIEL
jgi:hypothetical protein